MYIFLYFDLWVIRIFRSIPPFQSSLAPFHLLESLQSNKKMLETTSFNDFGLTGNNNNNNNNNNNKEITILIGPPFLFCFGFLICWYTFIEIPGEVGLICLQVFVRFAFSRPRSKYIPKSSKNQRFFQGLPKSLSPSVTSGNLVIRSFEIQRGWESGRRISLGRFTLTDHPRPWW